MANTTVNALQQSKEAQRRAQEIAFANAQRLAGEQKNEATLQAEALAKEAYVQKKQQERTLPTVMQQSGLAGTGYTETTANNIGNTYQNTFNNAMTNKQKSIDTINSGVLTAQSAKDQNLANIEAQYQADYASYLASLQKSGSSGSGSGSGGSKDSQETNPLKLAEKELAGFGWEPRDPNGSREKMKAALAKYVQNKMLSQTQVNSLIEEFMQRYYKRPQPGSIY